MNNLQSTSFSLENFHGPISLLLYLVQQKELDVCDIPIAQLTHQFDKEDMDESAEFLLSASSLLWLKSRALLPGEEVEVLDLPNLETIQHIADYVQLRNLAEGLQAKTATRFPRGVRPEPPPRELESVSIEELAILLDQLLAKRKSEPITDEEYRVVDALRAIRSAIEEGEIPFTVLFSLEKSRGELIVNFLAVLELIKLQELIILKKQGEIVLCPSRS